MTDIPKFNRPVFAQPVAVKATSAQIKFIYKPLSVLGYWEDDLRYQEGRNYLCTNSQGRPMYFGLTDKPTDCNRVLLEDFDHLCFLAVAAMTQGEKFIQGEYGKLGENIFQVGPVNNLRNLLYVCDINQWVPASELQKPTLNELLTFFYMPYVRRTDQLRDELPPATGGATERDSVPPQ